MNRQQRTFFIAETSNGADFLVLPKTYTRYPHLIASALARPLKSQEDFEVVGRRLVAICQLAHAARDITVLREASDFLNLIPVRTQLRMIGRYYQAQVLHRTKQLDAARTIFEELATHPQFPWKAKAIASIASCQFDNAKLDVAISFSNEALRANKDNADLAVSLNSQWLIAIIRSVQGDHLRALQLLESLYPFLRQVAKNHRAVYYDYLNSLAVRHLALNHFDEAERLNRITLASPCRKEFFPFYDTRDEIRDAREAVAATVFVNVDQSLQHKSEIETSVVEPSITPSAESNSDIAFNESLVEVQKNREHSLERKPERLPINFSLIAMRSAGAEVIAARLIRAKAAVAGSSNGVSKLFFTSVKPRAPPACITNREN